jgi:hypothetical protein
MDSNVTVSLMISPVLVAARIESPSLIASTRESVPFARVTRAVPGKHGSSESLEESLSEYAAVDGVEYEDEEEDEADVPSLQYSALVELRKVWQIAPVHISSPPPAVDWYESMTTFVAVHWQLTPLTTVGPEEIVSVAEFEVGYATW